jgi:CHAT domain
LRDRRDALEAELSWQVPEIRLERQLSAADHRAVAGVLPEGSALVEFVRFSCADFRASQWASDRYVAFVLPAAEPDGVRLLDLGAAEDMDRLIASLRAAVTGEAEGRGRRDVVRTGAAEGTPPDAEDGARLRVGVFDPLVAALGGRTRLLLAPDGDLNRLPFEVLPLVDGRRLIEEYRIDYLGTGRDVLCFGVRPTVPASEPLVIADPDFDLSAEPAPSPPPAATPFKGLPGSEGCRPSLQPPARHPSRG